MNCLVLWMSSLRALRYKQSKSCTKIRCIPHWTVIHTILILLCSINHLYSVYVYLICVQSFFFLNPFNKYLFIPLIDFIYSWIRYTTGLVSRILNIVSKTKKKNNTNDTSDVVDVSVVLGALCVKYSHTMHSSVFPSSTALCRTKVCRNLTIIMAVKSVRVCRSPSGRA